ncbi:hypothetical protein PG988_010428 [Apiospora saccharicola]
MNTTLLSGRCEKNTSPSPIKLRQVPQQVPISSPFKLCSFSSIIQLRQRPHSVAHSPAGRRGTRPGVFFHRCRSAGRPSRYRTNTGLRAANETKANADSLMSKNPDGATAAFAAAATAGPGKRQVTVAGQEVTSAGFAAATVVVGKRQDAPSADFAAATAVSAKRRAQVAREEAPSADLAAAATAVSGKRRARDAVQSADFAAAIAVARKCEVEEEEVPSADIAAATAESGKRVKEGLPSADFAAATAVSA